MFIINLKLLKNSSLFLKLKKIILMIVYDQKQKKKIKLLVYLNFFKLK